MNNRPSEQKLTKEEQKILQALVEADGPSGADDIAVATGLEPEKVSGRIAGLKQRGLIESPEHSRYAPSSKTGAALLKATGRLL